MCLVIKPQPVQKFIFCGFKMIQQIRNRVAHSTPSFARLQELGFYPDLVGNLRGFMELMHTKGSCGLGKQIAETIAAGYLSARAFSTEEFAPAPDDAFFELKVQYLKAVKEIHDRFGDRLPRQFYDTLAFMSVRSNPTQEERIPELEHLLPGGMDWKTADSVLHAMPLCSRLYLHVQTVINRETGRILGHGCGCSHSLASMPTCIVNAPMGDSSHILIEETESFLRHMLGQLFLLHFGLPQGIGPSVKMQVQDQSREARTAEALTLKISAHP